jgi:glyoxylase-like metal-dependent hydrolase (beta-lactamase superfamily II)
MNYRVISIGALEAHPLWKERDPVRTGHATTTLVRAGDMNLLIDPGLPGDILVARLAERANVRPTDVTHVFLSSFRPDVRRGLGRFEHATWWIGENERETVGVAMVAKLRGAENADDAELSAVLAQEIQILERCEPAPDKLAEGVDLFPLPGVTPGLCGVLLPEGRHTTLICGDAIPTWEHLEQGIVPRWAADASRARESFMEAVEIADLLVLGRDNLVVNPTKRPF